MFIDLTHGFRFGAFTAEPLKGCVNSDDGEVCHLPPKPMDVLVKLAEAFPEPVTREDLINSVWGERYVSDEVLTHAVKELRHALEDSPTEPRYIQTIPKRGYQLLTEARPTANAAPAEGRRRWGYLVIVIALAAVFLSLDRFVLDPATNADVTEASSEADDRLVTVSSVSVSTAYSIAVLPFDAMSNVPEIKYFADGLSEEIRYSLSQLPELRVIASASSSAFKDKGTPFPLLAQHLKVTYVLDGSVRKEGQQVRITAQLIDARTDSHIWSAAYDRSLDDTIATQKEIADQVVEHLRAALGTGEREAIVRIP